MIKVLIVDDSAVVRSLLTKGLGSCRDIQIVDTAIDPYFAREKIIQHEPDVLILDIEMPRMDGLTFLEKLMQAKPMPVIIFSSLTPAGCETALKAMDLGAVDVIHKPSLDDTSKLNEMIDVLSNAVRAAYAARHRYKDGYKPLKVPSKSSVLNGSGIKRPDKVIVIGASTGGTEALRVLLAALPATFPGIVIAQHMPEYFIKVFVESLSKICVMKVREARDKDEVSAGTVLIAPGNHHILLRRSSNRYFVEIKDGPQVYYQRPSIEVLFDSAAQSAAGNCIGVLLTGMGRDGATGLLHMKEAGACTIAQDEATSVVYGMPKVAAEIGAVERVLPLQDIAGELIKLVSEV